jgi:hypothetical protein
MAFGNASGFHGLRHAFFQLSSTGEVLLKGQLEFLANVYERLDTSAMDLQEQYDWIQVGHVSFCRK